MIQLQFHGMKTSFRCWILLEPLLSHPFANSSLKRYGSFCHAWCLMLWNHKISWNSANMYKQFMTSVASCLVSYGDMLSNWLRSIRAHVQCKLIASILVWKEYSGTYRKNHGNIIRAGLHYPIITCMQQPRVKTNLQTLGFLQWEDDEIGHNRSATAAGQGTGVAARKAFQSISVTHSNKQKLQALCCLFAYPKFLCTPN